MERAGSRQALQNGLVFSWRQKHVKDKSRTDVGNEFLTSLCRKTSRGVREGCYKNISKTPIKGQSVNRVQETCFSQKEWLVSRPGNAKEKHAANELALASIIYVASGL